VVTPPSVVMFVRNDASRDVRVLREAGSLTEAGWNVTIMALATKAGDLPDREERDGVEIRRVLPPSAWRERWTTVRLYPWRARSWVWPTIRRWAGAGPRGWLSIALAIPMLVIAVVYAALKAGGWLVRGRPRLTVAEHEDVFDWLVRWRWSVLGWADLAAAAAPFADVYHGHDLNALPAAYAARRRHGGHLVYDSHELFLEAGATARQPAWARSMVRRLERRWARAADVVVTVNESIAAELRQRYGIRRTVVVRNCPPRWTPPEPDRHPLRTALGVGLDTPIVLYHGGFLPDRGLDRLAAAVLDHDLAQVHLAFLGFGPGQAGLERLAATSRAGGRVHVLAAVPSDELLEWVADADVAAMPNQPVTLNERLSSPNKLFESIAAGTPVVSSDTPERRAIVLDDPLGPVGVVCDPTDPVAIAAAIRELLGRPAEERAVMRARCRAIAMDHLNWETEATRLVDVYRDLLPRDRAR
jgi:glycosyltransferase involved in cell wall biosynthesis